MSLSWIQIYVSLIDSVDLPKFHFLSFMFDINYCNNYLFMLIKKYVFTLIFTFYLLIPFNSMLIFFFKFIAVISYLIFIRTGIPRYRYDFLTKLGWLKFLVFNLILLLFLILFFYFF